MRHLPQQAIAMISLLALATGIASAQGPTNAASTGPALNALASGITVSAGIRQQDNSILAGSDASVPPGDTKDPTIAGILSFFIPGVGSFYAGNTTHGIIHLGIDLGSYAVIMGGVASCSTDCSGLGLAGVGYAVLLGNDIWSIFTAVNDAHAYNGDNGQKPGRVVGALYLSPRLRQLGKAERGTAARTGVQVLNLSF